MRVCLLNKWDVAGGASRAAYRLKSSLKGAGADVDYLVHHKATSDENVHEVESFYSEFTPSDESLIQKNYINRRRTAVSNSYFSVTCRGADFRDHSIVHSADVINLHWVEKFVSLSTIDYLLTLGKPVVWTLHDMRPFTGGCHYAAGCRQFVDHGCLDCIQLAVDRQKLPNAVMKAKKDVLKDGSVTIVSPSKWLATEASRSDVFRNMDVVVIPNSIETDIYRPRNRVQVRNRYGIPHDAFVILAGSYDNSERRKGYEEYQQAIRECLRDPEFSHKASAQEIVVVSFGSTTPCALENEVRHINIGNLNNDVALSELYSAADIYVLATLEDNLPNTVLESMACGTPVVSFSTGGIPDMVRNGVNGMLSKIGDPSGLSASILRMFKSPETVREYGEEAVRAIHANFTQAHQAKRYLALFERLIASPRVSPQIIPPAGFSEKMIYKKALAASKRAEIYHLPSKLIKALARKVRS